MVGVNGVVELAVENLKGRPEILKSVDKHRIGLFALLKMDREIPTKIFHVGFDGIVGRVKSLKEFGGVLEASEQEMEFEKVFIEGVGASTDGSAIRNPSGLSSVDHICKQADVGLHVPQFMESSKGLVEIDLLASKL